MRSYLKALAAAALILAAAPAVAQYKPGTVTYDDRGRLHLSVAENGQATIYTYDENRDRHLWKNGRLIASEKADGTVIAYAYDAKTGKRIQKRTTRPGHEAVYYDYPQAESQNAAEDPVLAPAVLTITEPIQSEPLRIPSNRELLSGWPDVEWDEYRRITKITSASGEITTYEYFDDDDRALIKARTFSDGRREEYTRTAAAFAFNVMLPFTQPLALRNDAEICEGTQSRVGFTGYFYNCTTKTYYTPSGRWYDPEIARFQQQDSYLGKIEDAPSLHRYTYADNNPTRYVDLTGHAAAPPPREPQHGPRSFDEQPWYYNRPAPPTIPGHMATEAGSAAYSFYETVTPGASVVRHTVQSGSLVQGTKDAVYEGVNRFGFIDEFNRRQQDDNGGTLRSLEYAATTHLKGVAAGPFPVEKGVGLAFGDYQGIEKVEAQGDVVVAALGWALPPLIAAKGAPAVVLSEGPTARGPRFNLVNPAPSSSAGESLIYRDPARYADTRAQVLQSELAPAQQGRVTMSATVVEDTVGGERRVLVSTSEPDGYIRPGVRLKPSEILVDEGTSHAERNTVAWLPEGARFWTGAGRPVYVACVEAVEGAGGVVASEKKPLTRAQKAASAGVKVEQ